MIAPRPSPLLLLLMLVGAWPVVHAQDSGPPIVITSPDHAVTFTYGSVKERRLYWNPRAGGLVAHIVFEDENQSGGVVNDDTLEFRLPGVTLDASRGIFYATTTTGEKIPVASFRHELFIKYVATLRNAIVRIQHPRGKVTVILEALRPDDPALKAKAPTDDDALTPHTFDLQGTSN